jgi:DNA-3-methyladenine glycosylase II
MNNFAQQLAEGQQHLTTNDERLAVVINRIGHCQYELRPDFFQTLVGSIISQQLSTKATSTIRSRLVVLSGAGLQPDSLKKLTMEELRSVGLSGNKAKYILNLARDYKPGLFNQLPTMPDQEAINFLTGFSGIGEWTAQMFLMFSLGRLDVLPVKDVGLRNGVKKIYNLDNLADDQLIKIAGNWQPYRSIGTWYAWRAADALMDI